MDEGMDVNVPAWGPKSQGETPLHLAAQGGHIKVMDELLERGANIDARTKALVAVSCLALYFLYLKHMGFELYLPSFLILSILRAHANCSIQST